MKNIAIFASGSGTNAENIIRYFSDSELARVTLIVCDNPHAGVIQRAEKHHIEHRVLKRAEIREEVPLLALLQEKAIDYIVLAGFLCLIPAALVERYHGRIVNIHPALLPAYGGKGMYGEHVHRAVIANGERESGITIHAVNEHYDSGDILAQFRTEVLPDDTPDTLAARIHALEYEHFPTIIENELKKL